MKIKSKVSLMLSCLIFLNFNTSYKIKSKPRLKHVVIGLSIAGTACIVAAIIIGLKNELYPNTTRLINKIKNRRDLALNDINECFKKIQTMPSALAKKINLHSSLCSILEKTNATYSDYKLVQETFEHLFLIVKSTTSTEELENKTVDLILHKLNLYKKMFSGLSEELDEFNKLHPVGTEFSDITEEICSIATKFPSKQSLSEIFKYTFKNELEIFGLGINRITDDNIFKKKGDCELLKLFKELEKMQWELDGKINNLNLTIFPYLINKHNQQLKISISKPNPDLFKNELGQVLKNFANDGSQCYANAMLQMIYNSGCLRKRLINIDDLKSKFQSKIRALVEIMELLDNAPPGQSVSCITLRRQFGFNQGIGDPMDYLPDFFEMIKTNNILIRYNDLQLALGIDKSIASEIDTQLKDSKVNYIPETVTITQNFIQKDTNPLIEYPYEFSYEADGKIYKFILKGIIQYGNGVHYSYYLFKDQQFIRISCTDPDFKVVSQTELSHLEPYNADSASASSLFGLEKHKVSHAYYERSDLIQTNLT